MAQMSTSGFLSVYEFLDASNMKSKICYFILASIFLQIWTASAWVWEDEDPYFSTSTTSARPPKPSPPTTQSPPTSTPVGDRTIRRCIKRCPSTSEYIPVCGSDGTTYNNEGKLVCAKICGVVVNKAYDGACDRTQSTTSGTISSTSGTTSTTSGTTSTTSGTTSSTSGTTSSPVVVTPEPVCFKKCPKTAEYNPLCGTNGVTYDNESRFRCAQQCGAQVEKNFDGTCGRPGRSTTARTPTVSTTLPPNFRSCVRGCIVSASYQPVCASDGNTYSNESELNCDISCGKNVQKVRNGQC